MSDGWMDGWMGWWIYGWVSGWVDGWMGEWVDDGWMDGWMDGRSDAKVISATEAAVTKPVGAGAAGSICVPSRILPGAPRSRPHSAVAQHPWQLHQGRSRPYFWRLGRGGPLRLVWGVLREPPPSADPSLFQTLGSMWSGSRRHFPRNRVPLVPRTWLPSFLLGAGEESLVILSPS